MRWNLNSQKPALASNLSAELSGALVDLLEEWERDFARAVLAGSGPRSRTPLHERAERSMRAGIAAAVLVAESVSEPDVHFMASVQGHADPDDSDGIEDRFAIYVDRVPKVDE